MTDAVRSSHFGVSARGGFLPDHVPAHRARAALSHRRFSITVATYASW